VHSNTLPNGFAQDDHPIVVENQRLHGVRALGSALTEPYWPNTPGRLGLYRPVTVATYAVEWDLWNGEPFGFHLVNVLLHAAVTGLVLLLLLEVGVGTLPAAAGAAVFAVHPVHVEAVANVVGRSELLAALFFLSACLLYRRASREWAAAAGVAGLCLLSMGAKEVGVTLPAAMLLLHPGGAARVLTGHHDRRRTYALCAVALSAYLFGRWAVTGVAVGADVAPWFWGEPGDVRLWTAVRLWPEYVRLMLFPASLSPDYGPGLIMPERSWASPLVLLGVLTGIAVAGAAVVLRKRVPLVTLGVSWFAVTVLPVSGLLFDNAFLLAERTLYLPSVGVALALAGVLEAMRARRKAWLRTAVPAMAVFVLAGAARSWIQNPVWRDDEVLFEYLVRRHPESYRSRLELFSRLHAVGREQEALAHLAAAAALVPGHFNVRMEYGRQLFVRGRYAEAAAQFDAARRIAPEVELAHQMYERSIAEARTRRGS
jgi:hypothetical protein